MNFAIIVSALAAILAPVATAAPTGPLCLPTLHSSISHSPEQIPFAKVEAHRLQARSGHKKPARTPSRKPIRTPAKKPTRTPSSKTPGRRPSSSKHHVRTYYNSGAYGDYSGGYADAGAVDLRQGPYFPSAGDTEAAMCLNTHISERVGRERYRPEPIHHWPHRMPFTESALQEDIDYHKVRWKGGY